MLTQYRNKLLDNEHLEVCPFCKRFPQLVQWPDRELLVLEHKCSMVSFEKVHFPDRVDEALEAWNTPIQKASTWLKTKVGDRHENS